MTKAEIALQGDAVEINSNEEAIDILDEIAEILEKDFTGAGVFKEAVKYCRGAEIKYLLVNTYEDMILISLPMTTDEDEEPFDILSELGVFGYVYNVTYSDLSELGYSFYKEYYGDIMGTL